MGAIGLIATLVAVALSPSILPAQQSVVISGRVSNELGAAVPGASVFVASLRIGTQALADGTYVLSVPAGRLRAGQTVQLSAQALGYRMHSVTLTVGDAPLRKDFQLAADALRLEEVVVVGAGVQTRAERLGTARATVGAGQVARANEPNVATALAGKVAGLHTWSQGGEPGASTGIRLRGSTTISGTGQPLFVVDGVPVNNSTRSTSYALATGSPLGGSATPNRILDLNPADIESIEILKGPAATSIYGAQAGAGGAVLITTKKGRAGQLQISLRSSLQLDEPARMIGLQQRYGMGTGGRSTRCTAVNCFVGAGFLSWGPALEPGTPVFDHARELYETGRLFDNVLTMSGGSDRSTIYLSLGAMTHDGFIVHDRDRYDRQTVRLNASHRFLDNLTVGANASYVQARGAFHERGNNLNGLLVGALRTPADFDNRQYLDPETGLHRSYRFPRPGPTAVRNNRGFDNPFYAINEAVHTSEVGRFFGNVTGEWRALDWLRLNYTMGADYANDDRLAGLPESSSGAASGGMVTRWQFYERIVDHNAIATAEYTLGNLANGNISVGQNLNETYLRQILVTGRGLLAPRPYKLSNTSIRDMPHDGETRVRWVNTLVQGTLDIADQLYLTGGATLSGSSSFSKDHLFAWYPRAQAAWIFTRALNLPETGLLSLGKLRVAYGESGQRPGAYLLQDVYVNSPIVDLIPGSSMQPTLGGVSGLYTSATKGNSAIRPERISELDAGLDVGLWGGRVDLGLTHYRSHARDVIFQVPYPPSTGFGFEWKNSAEIENRGWELSGNARLVESGDLTLDMGGNWATNRNKVLSLGDSLTTSVRYSASINGRSTDAVVGYPLGVFRGTDFYRCGQEALPSHVRSACAGAPGGALYVGEDGFPVQNPNIIVIGDPNHDWTAGLSAVLGFRALTLSAFVDVRKGGTAQNITRATLYSYGTHRDTEERAQCVVPSGQRTLACTGNEKVFGQTIMPGAVVGPGTGKPVPIGENWYNGLGGAGGPSAQFQEDASHVRLRELSIGYTFAQPWVKRVSGFSSIDARISGRNLMLWTDYNGFDPDVNVGGAEVGNRGIDLFVNPQTRAVVFSVGLNY